MKTIREVVSQSVGGPLPEFVVKALESREKERDEAERERVKTAVLRRLMLTSASVEEIIRAIYPPPEPEKLPPVDDDEPVTEEWLRSIGFTRVMQPSSTGVLGIGRLTVSIPDRYWVYGDMVLIRKHDTCGDVRRLCKALGIKLKGESNASIR